MTDAAENSRDRAVADYFRWNADGVVQAVSLLGSAAVLLTFAMLDRLADTGLGYGGHATHLAMLALAVALAGPIGFRERHTMLALRPIMGAMALACCLVPTVGWLVIRPTQGVTAHLPIACIVLAVLAFIPAASVLAVTSRERWQVFLDYCRAPSMWSRPRDGAT